VRVEEIGEPIRPVSLLTASGVYWAISNLVGNFIKFPPLGVVLVSMLGIGMAERTGMIAALLKVVAGAVPPTLLTPAVVFLGFMSHLGSDAGNFVLPPLAAALYKSAGRSPLVGIAAVFAGVAAGFNANPLITPLDPILAALSTDAARIIDPGYQVAVTCNWWFSAASTFVLTLTAWAVTAWFVEPRVGAVGEAGGAPARAERLTREEALGLVWALVTLAAVAAVTVALIRVPGAPLHGRDNGVHRWAPAVVPIIFAAFFVPGLVYGLAAGTVRREKDVTVIMVETMKGMAPMLVLAFFAAQFIEYFKYTNLGAMLAMSGGRSLAESHLGPGLLMALFILVTMGFNLFIVSMSAKWTLFAPIFIPMFMMAGISPALTQAAYRIGDSVTNAVSPLNPYLVVLLVFMRQHDPKAGTGTLLSLMVPYTVVFALVWTLLLLLWMHLGIRLGPGGPLEYVPAAG
jgi:aminobenzoyl-glutamate transport protein